MTHTVGCHREPETCVWLLERHQLSESKLENWVVDCPLLDSPKIGFMGSNRIIHVKSTGAVRFGPEK